MHPVKENNKLNPNWFGFGENRGGEGSSTRKIAKNGKKQWEIIVAVMGQVRLLIGGGRW